VVLVAYEDNFYEEATRRAYEESLRGEPTRRAYEDHS
jgi:hypothetical protein